MNFLENKKTYITGIAGIAIFVVENILGFDIPGITTDINTLMVAISALTIRHGISKK